MEEEELTPYRLRCRMVAQWTGGFAASLFVVVLVLRFLYPAMAFDFLPLVMLLFVRGVGRAAPWALRWQLVLVLTEGLTLLWMLAGYVFLLVWGVERIGSFDPQGLEAGILATLGAVYVAWALVLCVQLWGLLAYHPEPLLTRGYRLMISAVTALGLLFLPAFLAQLYHGLSSEVHYRRYQDLDLDGRKFSALIVVRGPHGHEHLGAVLVGRDREQVDVVVNEGASTARIVRFENEEEVPAGSVVWQAAEGEWPVIASGRTLDDVREADALRAIVQPWLAAHRPAMTTEASDETEAPATADEAGVEEVAR